MKSKNPQLVGKGSGMILSQCSTMACSCVHVEAVKGRLKNTTVSFALRYM